MKEIIDLDTRAQPMKVPSVSIYATLSQRLNEKIINRREIFLLFPTHRLIQAEAA